MPRGDTGPGPTAETAEAAKPRRVSTWSSTSVLSQARTPAEPSPGGAAHTVFGPGGRNTGRGRAGESLLHSAGGEDPEGSWKLRERLASKDLKGGGRGHSLSDGDRRHGGPLREQTRVARHAAKAPREAGESSRGNPGGTSTDGVAEAFEGETARLRRQCEAHERCHPMRSLLLGG